MLCVQLTALYDSANVLFWFICFNRSIIRYQWSRIDQLPRFRKKPGPNLSKFRSHATIISFSFRENTAPSHAQPFSITKLPLSLVTRSLIINRIDGFLDSLREPKRHKSHKQQQQGILHNKKAWVFILVDFALLLRQDPRHQAHLLGPGGFLFPVEVEDWAKVEESPSYVCDLYPFTPICHAAGALRRHSASHLLSCERYKMVQWSFVLVNRYIDE